MANPREILLRRCNRLASSIGSPDEIDVTDLAFGLRQILLDKHSLIDLANDRNVRINFVVGCIDWDRLSIAGMRPTLGGLIGSLDPINEDGSIRHPHAILNKDQFLKHIIFLVGEHDITVKDIIRYHSNAAGAVHYDPTPRPEYEVLHSLNDKVEMFGMRGTTHILRSIAIVTLRAVDPLLGTVSD